MTSTEKKELISTLEDQVLELADHEAWLDAQIKELEFANRQETTSIPDDNRLTADIRKELEQRIDLLKEELVRKASMDYIKTKVIDSAHAYRVVLTSLFKGNDELDENPLAKLIEERDEAVSRYLLIHQELQQVRRELSVIEVQVLDCQDNNRKLAQLLSEETISLKETTASQDSGSNRRMAQRIEEELKNVNIKHNVISNVLQGLLLESGVDWSNDPHYLDVMLKLSQ